MRAAIDALRLPPEPPPETRQSETIEFDDDDASGHGLTIIIESRTADEEFIAFYVIQMVLARGFSNFEAVWFVHTVNMIEHNNCPICGWVL